MPRRSRANSTPAPPNAAMWQPALWNIMFTFSGTSAIVQRPATFTAPPHASSASRQGMRFSARPSLFLTKLAHTLAVAKAAVRSPAMKR